MHKKFAQRCDIINQTCQERAGCNGCEAYIAQKFKEINYKYHEDNLNIR